MRSDSVEGDVHIPPIALAVWLAMTASVCASPRLSSTDGGSIACKTAESVLPSLRAPGITFSLRPPTMGPSALRDLDKGWSASPPPADLIETLRRASAAQSIFECPNIASQVEAAGARLLSAAEATSFLQSSDHAVYVTEISLPLLSRDQKTAVILVQDVGSKFGGGARLLKLTRVRGKWAVESFKMLYII